MDSILHEGSQVLKRAIAEEFRANVHLLLKKLERDSIGVPSPPPKLKV